MIVFLDAQTLGDIDLGLLNQFGPHQIFHATKPTEVVERVRDSRVIITNKVKLFEEVLSLCKRLEYIIVTATGIDNVDLDYCKKNGISVLNAAGYSSDSVVTHTFSMLFYFLHNIGPYQQYTQRGDWMESSSFTYFDNFHELSSKSWGIIGMGEIGRRVAKIAESFGCQIAYFSTSGRNNNQPFSQKDLHSLLKESDIISIHAPLNIATKNLIGRKELDVLKENAILLNLGRGGIINEKDLSDYLLNDSKVKVGLDVVMNEPMEKNSPLVECLQLPNLLITPHLAWASIEARQRLWGLTIKNLQKIFEV